MTTINGAHVKKLVVACDAGMGSSALVSTQLATALTPHGVAVEHAPVRRIPDDADLVLCHTGLASRVRAAVPRIVVVEFQMFLGDPAFTWVEQAIKGGEVIGA